MGWDGGGVGGGRWGGGGGRRGGRWEVRWNGCEGEGEVGIGVAGEGGGVAGWETERTGSPTRSAITYGTTSRKFCYRPNRPTTNR